MREPIGAIAMIHGFGEHAGRYLPLHRAFNAAGFAVAAADLRGFGHSPGPRGHIERWDDYRRDAAAIVAQAALLASDRPVFLFGHSMGGLIVLDYALQHPEGLAGVVASAPALIPGGARKPLLEIAARLLSRLVPRAGTRLGLDPAGISSQPEEVAAYLADPLVSDRTTMRWGAEILRIMPDTLAQAGRFALPLLLLQGSDDPINAPAGTRAFHATCGHPDCTLKFYPGNRHEVHHDISRSDFERDLIRWLKERAMRAPSATGVQA
jgi:alpha-beta hydrolase superfamily lysophospholipase